jgi:hypothetical protein
MSPPGKELALAVMPLPGCFSPKFFWGRCFGHSAAVQGAGMAHKARAALAPSAHSACDQDDDSDRDYYNGEDFPEGEEEVVSVHRFAHRIIADYMPSVTAAAKV